MKVGVSTLLLRQIQDSVQIEFDPCVAKLNKEKPRQLSQLSLISLTMDERGRVWLKMELRNGWASESLSLRRNYSRAL